MSRFLFSTYRELFPDEDACLNWIFNLNFGNFQHCPKCNKPFDYCRVEGRKCYQCRCCGNQIYPTAITLLRNSKIPLDVWFHTVYQFAISKKGIDAQAVAAMHGISYMAARRMSMIIRRAMAERVSFDGGDKIYEIDESFLGGRKELNKVKDRRGIGQKMIVAGIKERGGKVALLHAKRKDKKTLLSFIEEHIPKGATICTDQYAVYKNLTAMGYDHRVVEKKGSTNFRRGIHTNNIEGTWMRLKVFCGEHTGAFHQNIYRLISMSIALGVIGIMMLRNVSLTSCVTWWPSTFLIKFNCPVGYRHILLDNLFQFPKINLFPYFSESRLVWPLQNLNMRFTIATFNQQFPNDDACLDYLFKVKFEELKGCPCCGLYEAKYYRVKKRKCYECGICKHQIYPMKGTILEGSTTSLTKWFYAIYLFSVSKNGVSGKELERALGITYRAAWRMGHKIRELMAVDEDKMLSGFVEVDESLMGGKVRGGKRGWGAENKTCLFGMVERGGRVKVLPVPDRTRETLFPIIKDYIVMDSMVYSDELRVYRALPDEGYGHQRVVHSRCQWTNGACHTNSIEGYWSNLKKSILSTHTYVSPQHMQKYLDEFAFRHNHRKGNIFATIMQKIIYKNC